MATISTKEFFSKGPVKVVGSDNDAFQATQQTEDPGFLESLWRGTKQFGSGVKNAYNERLKQGTEIKQRQAEGQGKLSTVLQIGGLGAGFIGDIAGEGVKAGVRALPDQVEQPLKNTVKSTASAVMNAGPTQDVIKRYEAWKTLNPEMAANLESTVNIASLIPIGKGAQLAKEGAEATIEQGIKTAGKVATKSGELVEQGIKAGKQGLVKVGTKASDIVTPIEKGVVNELEKAGFAKKTITDRFTKYTDQAMKAIEDYSQPTPLDLAGEEALRVLKGLGDKVKQAGEAKSAITKKLGAKGAGPVVQEALAKLQTGVNERFGGVFTKTGDIISSRGRSLKITNTEKNLINTVKGKLESVKNFPTIQKVDDVVDFIQDALYKSNKNLTLPTNPEVVGFLKEVEGSLNSGLKKIAGSEYSNANKTFREIKEVTDQLNKALGVDGNKGASLMKQLFSPNGTAPRKLFQKVQELTGTDLVNEATLAKYAMEKIGDVRQASLLEQVLTGQATSKTGLVSIAGEKLLNKIQDPIGKAKRIIERTPEKVSSSVKQIDDLTKKEMEEAIDYIRLQRAKSFNQVTEESIGKLAEKFGIKSKSYSVIANKLQDLIEKTKTKKVK